MQGKRIGLSRQSLCDLYRAGVQGIYDNLQVMLTPIQVVDTMESLGDVLN